MLQLQINNRVALSFCNRRYFPPVAMHSTAALPLRSSLKDGVSLRATAEIGTTAAGETFYKNAHYVLATNTPFYGLILIWSSMRDSTYFIVRSIQNSAQVSL